MKNKTNLWILAGYLLNITVLASCGKESGYQQYRATMEKELASGERADSLFFGIHLGMTSSDFYGHCWEMNKKGLFTDGAGNTAVLYQFKDQELKHPASMNFYPDFYEDKIYRMQVNYEYDGWAPWNKHLFADSMQEQVLQLYKKWYPEGNSFIKVKDKDRGTIYVKVDRNRRIIIGKFSDSKVKVDFTDLLVEEKILKQYGKEKI